MAVNPPAAPALALTSVSCTFVDRNAPGQRYTAVRDVTLTVGAGEFVSVVGPTGFLAAGPGEIIKAVPESYLLGDRAVYIDAFLASKGALSPDGMIPEGGAATALRALQSVDETLKDVKFDLPAVYTNEFVKKANARFAGKG